MQPLSCKPRRRSDRRPRSVLQCGPIAALAARARALDALDRQLRQSLPPRLRQQVRLAQVDECRWVFLAPTPAWAARLRLSQSELLQAARALGTRADAIVVKVAPLPPPKPQAEPNRSLSPAAADHLRSAAAALSDHELRALFISLASLAK